MNHSGGLTLNQFNFSVLFIFWYSGPRCVAKFEYHSDDWDDLSFPEGAVIKLVEKVDSEWYKGEYNGQSGIFPKGYVDVLEDLPSKPTSVSPALSLVSSGEFEYGISFLMCNSSSHHICLSSYSNDSVHEHCSLRSISWETPSLQKMVLICSFRDMKQIECALLPPDRTSVLYEITPLLNLVPISAWWIGTSRGKCLAQRHSTATQEGFDSGTSQSRVTSTSIRVKCFPWILHYHLFSVSTC